MTVTYSRSRREATLTTPRGFTQFNGWDSWQASQFAHLIGAEYEESP